VGRVHRLVDGVALEQGLVVAWRDFADRVNGLGCFLRVKSVVVLGDELAVAVPGQHG